jgi:UDP:flavonoid glycosyltransferase YjiC (YdhE family)
VGHHGGLGTTAAAMVHRVLLIDMCLVLDLFVGMVLTYCRSTLLIR